MAKRAREKETGRDRNPPVRMTGMGLMQVALFCGLGAIDLVAAADEAGSLWRSMRDAG